MTRYQLGNYQDVYFVVDTEIEEDQPRILCIGPDFWTATRITEALNGLERTAVLLFLKNRTNQTPENVISFTGNWHPNNN